MWGRPLHEDAEPESAPPFDEALAALPNAELLSALDLTLLELERRLLRYAQKGAEILEMADEGLTLAARASARLAQAQSAAVHTQSHLQVTGIGSWSPRSTRPSWGDDPRVVGDAENE
jgi:hypothetical protein